MGKEVKAARTASGTMPLEVEASKSVDVLGGRDGHMGTAVGVGVDPAGAIERVRVDQGAQFSNAERPMVQAPPSFKILRTLGVGGQGQVYLAIHTSTPQGFVGASVRCPVALKVLEKQARQP